MNSISKDMLSKGVLRYYWSGMKWSLTTWTNCYMLALFLTCLEKMARQTPQQLREGGTKEEIDSAGEKNVTTTPRDQLHFTMLGIEWARKKSNHFCPIMIVRSFAANQK